MNTDDKDDCDDNCMEDKEAEKEEATSEKWEGLSDEEKWRRRKIERKEKEKMRRNIEMSQITRRGLDFTGTGLM